jgi:glycosyltransferase involved in cell wall biosynthesis
MVGIRHSDTIHNIYSQPGANADTETDRRSFVKALVVAPQPFFNYRGTPFSVYYRTMVVAEKGVEMDFLTYGQGMDVDIPGVRLLRIPAFRFLGPIPIGPSGLKLFLDVFLVIRLFWLLLRNRYDFVHAHEEAVFFCALLKPLFRFKMIYDMHSSLPQQLTNFNYTKSKILIGLFTRLEDLAIRRANAVITICPDLADYVLARITDREKHFLIENSIFDPVRLRQDPNAQAPGPAKPQDAEQQLSIPPGSKAVVYAGTFEHYQGVDILIEAFCRVHRESPEAYLVLVGGTAAQVAQFRTQAGELLSGACVIRERMSQAAVKTLIAGAAVQMSPRSSGTNTPLKIYEQLASGVPLVATAIYSHTQVLSDEVAYLVKPEPEAMAAGILKALADGVEGNPRAKAAKALYAARYSRPVYEQKIERLLERIRSCAV